MKDRFRPAKPVNGIVYHFLSIFLRRPVLRFFKVQAVNLEEVPLKGPGILLVNHVNLFDPFWVAAMVPRPTQFVVTEHVFRNRFLAFWLRGLGCFPKRKAARDMTVIRNMIRFLKEGALIGIYPEGNRTWDGLNQPMQPGIAAIIRRMNVPVICCRLEGAYLHLPRWANKLRRIPVKGIFKRLYDSGSIPDDPDQIMRDISTFLRNRDYETPINEKRYHFRGLANDVTKLIYRCPGCGTIEGLKIVKPLASNRVECVSCFSSWKITLSGRIIPLNDRHQRINEGITFADCYAQIKDFTLHPIHTYSEISLQQDEQLYLISRPYILKTEEAFPLVRILGKGRMYLTDRRFIFKNSNRTLLDVPVGELKSLSTEPGNYFDFVVDGKLYQIAILAESILKWFDTILRIQRKDLGTETKQ
jgi:1-acyl-sn-glycerol-3-phosphate acyltransferase